MPSIFISYRRSDSGGHAGRLFDRLRCWFDTNQLFFDVSSIDWGEDFPEEIEQAIRKAKAVLVLIGPDWLENINNRADMPCIDFVRQEISITLERREEGEVEIFPILVGNAEMPNRINLHDDLKDEIGKLLEYHAHEFPADTRLWDFQFERLRKYLTKVEGIPRPCAQFPQNDGSLILRFDSVEPTTRPVSLNVQAVQRAFGTVSTALLNWPQDTDGQWIERPELDRLHKLTTRRDSVVTVLLGEPGGGKSAILARLGTKLSKEGAVLLAIKADQLPRCTETLQDLEDWIGCDVPATEALCLLANNNRVVVLIDQLDALSDLMDQHSERLGSLIKFINTVRDIPNLSVIVSCREFEFRNDVRVSTLNAEEVLLVRLTWEQVEPLLTARGLETSGWSDEVRDVLRTPQHLIMFLSHLADNDSVPLFTNYQGLLTRIVRERLENVHGSRTVEAAERIAVEMAAEEELWLGRERFEPEFGFELERLVEAGFLLQSDTGLSIAFRHQTVFDFLRARRFLRDGQPLVKYIVEQKQQSLFVRPILWSTLNYLRASDRAVYRQQLFNLWRRKDLRPHIRDLLVAFLGQVPDPDTQEAQLLFSRLEENALRPRILRATAGSPGWFDRLASRLPDFMTAEPEVAWGATAILRRAVTFAPSVVLRAVKRYWITNEDFLRCALSVMREFNSWDDCSVDVVCKLADFAPDNTFWFANIAKRISETRPDLAPKVVARYLQARTLILAENRPNMHRDVAPAPSVSGQIEQTIMAGDKLRSYEQLVDNNSDWPSLDKVARRAPKVFVQEMWPWLVELFSLLGREDYPHQLRYRNHHGLAFKRDSNKKQPLLTAIEIAVCGFAETEVEEFINFLDRNKGTDLNVLHRLFSLGLKRIARKQSKVVLQYLLDDPRRFSIGGMVNEHGDTQALISAAVPSLQKDEALRLETAIREWEWYRETTEGVDAETQFKRLKWMRERRLRLLWAFPFDKLSPTGQRHIREEERALPDASIEDRHIGGGWIVSPMSGEQMEKATDEQILVLFEELHDGTEQYHPRRWKGSVGGSVQASREFASFASKVPHRALHLILRFQAGKTERPA